MQQGVTSDLITKMSETIRQQQELLEKFVFSGLPSGQAETTRQNLGLKCAELEPKLQALQRQMALSERWNQCAMTLKHWPDDDIALLGEAFDQLFQSDVGQVAFETIETVLKSDYWTKYNEREQEKICQNIFSILLAETNMIIQDDLIDKDISTGPTPKKIRHLHRISFRLIKDRTKWIKKIVQDCSQRLMPTSVPLTYEGSLNAIKNYSKSNYHTSNSPPPTYSQPPTFDLKKFDEHLSPPKPIIKPIPIQPPTLVRPLLSHSWKNLLQELTAKLGHSKPHYDTHRVPGTPDDNPRYTSLVTLHPFSAKSQRFQTKSEAEIDAARALYYTMSTTSSKHFPHKMFETFNDICTTYAKMIDEDCTALNQWNSETKGFKSQMGRETEKPKFILVTDPSESYQLTKLPEQQLEHFLKKEIVKETLSLITAIRLRTWKKPVSETNLFYTDFLTIQQLARPLYEEIFSKAFDSDVCYVMDRLTVELHYKMTSWLQALITKKILDQQEALAWISVTNAILFELCEEYEVELNDQDFPFPALTSQMFRSLGADSVKDFEKIMDKTMDRLSNGSIDINVSPSPFQIEHQMDTNTHNMLQSTLTDTTESINNMSSSLRQMKLEVEFSNNVHNKIDRTIQVVDSMADQAKQLKSSLAILLSDNSTDLVIKIVEAILSTITMVWALIICPDTKVRMLIVSTWALANGILSKAQKAVMASITFLTAYIGEATSAYDTDGKLISQAGKEKEPLTDQEVENVFMPMFGVISRMFGVKDSKTHTLDSHRIKRFREHLGFIRDTGTTFQLIHKWAVMILEMIYQKITGEPWLSDDYKLLLDSVKKWHADSTQFLNIDYSVEIPLKPDYARRVIDLCKEGDNIGNLIIGMDLRSKFSSFFEAKARLQQIKTYADNALRMDTGRKEPIWIHLFGSPGHGKTTLAKIIARDLVNCIGLKFSHNSVYLRTTAKFWNGYAHQPIIIINDLMQDDREDAKTEQAYEIILIVNGESYPVDMADLNSKGSTFCDSCVLITTSNKFNLVQCGAKIADIQALLRRRTLNLEVIVVKDNLDKDIMGKTIVKSKNGMFDPTVYRMRAHDVEEETEVRPLEGKKILLYEDVIRYLKNMLQERMKEGSSLMEQLILTQPSHFLSQPEKMLRDKLYGADSSTNLNLERSSDSDEDSTKDDEEKVMQAMAEEERKFKERNERMEKELEKRSQRKKPKRRHMVSQMMRDEEIPPLIDDTPDLLVPSEDPNEYPWPTDVQRRVLPIEQVTHVTTLTEMSSTPCLDNLNKIVEENSRKAPQIEQRITQLEEESKKAPLSPGQNTKFDWCERCSCRHSFHYCHWCCEEGTYLGVDDTGLCAKCQKRKPSIAYCRICKDAEGLEDLIDGYCPECHHLIKIKEKQREGLLEAKEILADQKKKIQSLWDETKNWFASWQIKIKEWSLRAKNAIKEHKDAIIITVLTALGIIGAGYGLYALACKPALTIEATPTEETQAFSDLEDAHLLSQSLKHYKHTATSDKAVDRKIRIPPKTANVTKGRPKFSSQSGEDAKSQSGMDQAAYDIAQHKLAENGCILRGKDITGKTIRVYGLFITGRGLMTVGHFWAEGVAPDDHTITVETRRGTFQLTNADYEMYTFLQDLAYLQINPKKIPQEFANIVHLFIKNEDTEYSLGGYALFIWDPKVCILKVGTNPRYTTKMKYQIDGTDKWVFDATGIICNLPSQTGWCGSPGVINNPKIPRKLCSVHGSGDNFSAGGHLVTQEILLEVIGIANPADTKRVVIEEPVPIMKSQLGTESPCPIPLDPTEKPQVKLGENLQFIGVVSKEFKVRQPTKSELVPSVLYGEICEPTTAPAVLKPQKQPDGSTKSPFTEALKKLDRPENTYTHPKMDTVLQYMLDRQVNKVGDVHVWTMDEALNGPKGYKYAHALDKSTSACYGPNAWVVIKPHGIKGKGFLVWVEERPQGPKMHPTEPLLQAHQKLMDGYDEHGPKQWMIVMDCLKDEERSLEKIAALKTRLFSGMPLEHTLGMRQYFGDFVENEMLNHPDGYCALGVNPHSSTDWKRMYDRLTAWAKKYLAGDLENCDATIPRILALYFLKYVQAWYDKYNPNENDETRRRRKGLFMDVVDTIHIAINVLYSKTFGNVSGQFTTTVLNSFALAFLKWLSALILTEEGREDGTITHTLTDEEIMDKVDPITFGDDNVTAVGEEIADYYTMPAVTKILSRFGMIYTDFLKRPTMPDHYTIQEIEFLKRKFRPSGPWVFAPLRESVIDNMSNWISCKGKMDRNEASYLKSVRELYEFFHHGREKFDIKKERLNRAHERKGLPPLTLQYQSLYNKYTQLGAIVTDNESTQHWEALWAHFQQSQADEEVEIAEALRNMLNFEAQPTPYTPKPKKEETPHIDDAFDFSNFKSQMSVSTQVTKEETKAIEEVKGLTAFADPVPTIDPQAEMLATISPIHKGTDPHPDQSLKEVLSRVYPVTSFTWDGSSARNTKLITLSWPKLLYDVPTIKEKLNTFQYFRAGVHVKLELQTTDFNYGSLLIVVVPHIFGPTNIQNPFQNIYVASSNVTYELSAGKGGVAEFDIPFISGRDYWNMKDSSAVGADAYGFFGQAYVFVEHPLALQGSGTTPSMTVTVHSNFINPEVAGPGLRDAIVERKRMDVDDDFDFSTFRSQSGTEANIKSVEGSVSSILEKGGKVLGKIGDAALGSLSIASSVMGVAHTLMDKPTSVQAPQRCVNEIAPGMANTNGLDNSVILSTDPENKVANDPKYYCTPVDYDLMHNTDRIPGLIATGEITASDLAGTKILQLPVTPMLCKQELITTVLNFYRPWMCFRACNFSYWRGSIDFLWQFRTSNNISCRMRLTHVPDPSVTGAIANDVAGDTISKVFQVKGDTDIKVKIPYLQDKPYLQTGNLRVVNTTPLSSTLWGLANGQIYLQIINPLITNNTTGTVKIYYSVRVAAGSDLDLVRINRQNFITGLTTKFRDGTDGSKPVVKVEYTKTKKTQRKGEEEDFSNFKSQMAVEPMQNDYRGLFRADFEPMIPATAREFKGVLMGEHIERWSELLKRFEFFSSDNSAISSLTLDPWLRAQDELTTHAQVLRAFHFYRGSMRYKAHLKECSTNQATWKVRDITQYDLDDAQDCYFNGTHLSSTFINGVIEFQIPMYYDMNFFDQAYVGKGEMVNRPKAYLEFSPFAASSGYNAELYYAVGDDFSIGWPLNPIVLVVHTVSDENESKAAIRPPLQKGNTGSQTKRTGN